MTGEEQRQVHEFRVDMAKKGVGIARVGILMGILVIIYSFYSRQYTLTALWSFLIPLNYYSLKTNSENLKKLQEEEKLFK